LLEPLRARMRRCASRTAAAGASSRLLNELTRSICHPADRAAPRSEERE